MDAGLLIALTGLITAMGAIATALFTNKSAATKMELESLRETIRLLQSENRRSIEETTRLQKRLADLECERQSNRERISTLEEQVQELEEQVRRMGGTPVTNFINRKPPQ